MVGSCSSCHCVVLTTPTGCEEGIAEMKPESTGSLTGNVYDGWQGCSGVGCVVQDLGLRFVRLDGSTAVAERLTIVDS